MAPIYSNGGNRWNILRFNFINRDALSSVYKISMVFCSSSNCLDFRSCCLSSCKWVESQVWHDTPWTPWKVEKPSTFQLQDIVTTPTTTSSSPGPSSGGPHSGPGSGCWSASEFRRRGLVAQHMHFSLKTWRPQWMQLYEEGRSNIFCTCENK